MAMGRTPSLCLRSQSMLTRTLHWCCFFGANFLSYCSFSVILSGHDKPWSLPKRKTRPKLESSTARGLVRAQSGKLLYNSMNLTGLGFCWQSRNCMHTTINTAQGHRIILKHMPCIFTARAEAEL